jgi:hypothetical protein
MQEPSIRRRIGCRIHLVDLASKELIFLLIGAISSIDLPRAVQRRDDLAPFTFSAPIFTVALGTVARSFWPYIIAFARTVDQAASPSASLTFMFWVTGLFVMPLTLIDTLVVYRLYRGRRRRSVTNKTVSASIPGMPRRSRWPHGPIALQTARPDRRVAEQDNGDRHQSAWCTLSAGTSRSHNSEPSRRAHHG